VDVGGLRVGQSQPGLLDRVVGVADRAEHAVGHRVQVLAVRLEGVEHGYLSGSRFVLSNDNSKRQLKTTTQTTTTTERPKR
jgi:hypothetical protein